MIVTCATVELYCTQTITERFITTKNIIKHACSLHSGLKIMLLYRHFLKYLHFMHIVLVIISYAGSDSETDEFINIRHLISQQNCCVGWCSRSSLKRVTQKACLHHKLNWTFLLNFYEIVGLFVSIWIAKYGKIKN